MSMWKRRSFFEVIFIFCFFQKTHALFWWKSKATWQEPRLLITSLCRGLFFIPERKFFVGHPVQERKNIPYTTHHEGKNDFWLPHNRTVAIRNTPGVMYCRVRNSLISWGLGLLCHYFSSPTVSFAFVRERFVSTEVSDANTKTIAVKCVKSYLTDKIGIYGGGWRGELFGVLRLSRTM
jgi:hypothetical protein